MAEKNTKMINITFPDGNMRQYPQNITPFDVAISISEGLARNIYSATVNDEVYELNQPITSDATILFHNWDHKLGRATYWHSSAHLMAEAVESLFPGVKFGIGPDIEQGFYYDIDFGDYTIEKSDLKKIEKKMIELAKQKQSFERQDISKKDAMAFFSEKGDEYKMELIEELEDGQITFYKTGEFVDLCRGPHLSHTKSIKAIKLLNIAGAYWRGDENRKMMTRIYGITFPQKSQLKEYLVRLEEAQKRDHRKLGAQLELFMFSEKVGSGLPIWLPKGTALRARLENFLKEEQIKRGYESVITPHLGKKDLYVTSGHYAKYGEDSFQPIHTPREGEEFLLKPMNCPHHCEIYKNKPVSYKDLPIRLAEFGTVYRYEQSGELHGLTRVRGFTQDDAHIFCMADQLKDEFLNVLDLTETVLKKLGFEDYTVQISLRDKHDRDKYIGKEENWDKAEKAIIDAANEAGLETTTEYGEAAFYGPKLDFMIKDAIGRAWQLGTIQVDYNLPERFELEYTGSDNQPHRPVMIHRAPFGSLERFVAVLIEHTGGKFPLWLAPNQFAILPISDQYIPYAKEVLSKLESEDLRGRIDDRTESIGRKIRDTELERIPYMIIAGEKEMNSQTVSIRKQGEGDLGSMSVPEFKNLLQSKMDEY